MDEPLSFTGVHAEFMADTSEQIDFEGARYSGKTWACCAKVIYSCKQFPGIEWLICRYANEETEKKVVPEFKRICSRMGEYPDWNSKEACFTFANGSKVYAYGLRSQDKLGHLSKVRGLDVAGIWNDQSEETPQAIGEELPFGTRQPGFPHQVIFSPNPPPEEHWLSDFFPEDNSIAGRKYYKVSLYDNPHCPEEKLAELERLYPPTHARYKTLVLGQRGPASVGTPIYDDAYDEALHCGPIGFNAEHPLLESIHAGQHHPVWIAAQRNYFGGIEILGGIMGKRLMLEDFLPIVDRYRAEWFDRASEVKTCCDPPTNSQQLRFTNVEIMRQAKLKPRWSQNSTSPDVREAVIQSIAGYMRKRLGKNQAFRINSDPTRWLMASHAVIKQSKFFIDGLQANYVWDENMVSVGNKLYRQPKANEWVAGAQRCLENLMLNFWSRKSSQSEQDQKRAQESVNNSGGVHWSNPSSSWLGS